MPPRSWVWLPRQLRPRPISVTDPCGLKSRWSASGSSLIARPSPHWLRGWARKPVDYRGVFETLLSIYGPTRKLSAADIEPYLGASGTVPPWDLTDAIDRGDTKIALELLARMTQVDTRCR